MKVFKFGGASVGSAESVRNLRAILQRENGAPLIVVVSAMGKTTNALEELVMAWFRRGAWEDHFASLSLFHRSVASELLSHEGQVKLEGDLENLQSILGRIPPDDFNEAYDRVVSHGELFSSRIISLFLQESGMSCVWLDARKLVITDNLFREANVDWVHTNERIRNAVDISRRTPYLAITQGFIGASVFGVPTTLGREGSDYTAAIFASALDADEVVIWKDVEGLLNADPKFFAGTRLLEKISYREAIELSYYGATIIHPKTIKPLENKEIPLYVKSFRDPVSPGSVIRTGEEYDHIHPSYIFKTNQVLLTLSARDFSFMDERQLSAILEIFADEHIKLNLMQNSAISLSACFDYREDKFGRIMERLQEDFRLKYNRGLELITIRHYDEEVIAEITEGKEILLEQRSRITAQFVAIPKETA